MVLELPTKNLYAKDDASYSPVYTHITKASYSMTVTDQQASPVTTTIPISAVTETKTSLSQTIRIQMTVGDGPTNWKGVAGDTLRLTISGFLMPEIGKPMENIRGSIRTDNYGPCAAHQECYIENIKAHPTSKIEATLPRLGVGEV